MPVLNNERQLIRACLANKRRAQTTLYNRYKGKMYGVCLRYAKSEAQAQDFLQEGFLKVFRSLSQYRYEVPVEFWMKRIIINACISELRRKKEPLNQALPIETIGEPKEEEPIGINTSDLSTTQLLNLIQKLPEGYRAIFNLYAIEGYDHQEISEIMGISSGTSRSQYARARKLLAKQVKQELNQRALP
ncbi:MAG: sigma-70 family RNA polymerase sigma factor [Bacteroidota bacterium]